MTEKLQDECKIWHFCMCSNSTCVCKCETKAQVRECVMCVVWGTACRAASGGRGVCVKDRWSLSGVVPPLSLSFSLPSGSHILPLSALQNLTSSIPPPPPPTPHLSFASLTIILLSFTLKSNLGPSLTLLFLIFSNSLFPSPDTSLLPSCQAFCWRNQLEKSKRSICHCHSGPFWRSNWPARSKLKTFGIYGGKQDILTEKQKGNDWQLWPMNTSEYCLNITWFWNPPAGFIAVLYCTLMVQVKTALVGKVRTGFLVFLFKPHWSRFAVINSALRELFGQFLLP